MHHCILANSSAKWPAHIYIYNRTYGKDRRGRGFFFWFPPRLTMRFINNTAEPAGMAGAVQMYAGIDGCDG